MSFAEHHEESKVFAESALDIAFKALVEALVIFDCVSEFNPLKVTNPLRLIYWEINVAVRSVKVKSVALVPDLTSQLNLSAVWVAWVIASLDIESIVSTLCTMLSILSDSILIAASVSILE